MIQCEACRLGEHSYCVELRRRITDRATPIQCWCDCDISKRRPRPFEVPPEPNGVEVPA